MIQDDSRRSVVFYDNEGLAWARDRTELADKRQLFANPQYPYTEALLSAVPVPEPAAVSQRIVLQGDVPSPINPPAGCHFHPRCPYALARCRSEAPLMREVEPGHFAACHLRAGAAVQPSGR
jgi:oligopeptide/dipeptide ABC transporter ATP-binding protein